MNFHHLSRDNKIIIEIFFIFKDADGNFLTSKPLITWRQMTSKMGWGVIFLLGGGFAMATGITSSGLGQFVGLKMSGLTGA